jgi:hypothetical protein
LKMAGWYVRRGDSVIGPADPAKLKELVAAGKLLRTDQLAKDAAGPWTEAGRSVFFAPRPGANIMPPPLPIARGAIPPAPPVQPEQDQPAGVGKVATMARTSKAIVVTVGQSALAAGGAVSRAISTGSQRRHELKLAKIQADALAAGQRPAEVNVRMMTGTSGFGVASLVLGIIACLTCWIPFIGLLSMPLAALGLFFGFIGLCVSMIGRRSGVGMPVAGAVVCATALYIAIGTTGAVVSAIGSAADAGRPTPAAPNQASQQKPAPTISGPPSTPTLPDPASPNIPAVGPTPTATAGAPDGAAAAPSEDAPTPPVADADGASGPRATRLGQTLTLDQLKVTPQKVELKRVRGKWANSTDGENELPEPVLALTLLVENISQGQVFSPYAWAKGKDSFGNELEEVGTDFARFYPAGSAQFDDLKPGRQAIVILCLKPKIDTAASYRWEIMQTCTNKKESYQHWVLEFKAAEMGDRAAAARAAPIPSNSANHATPATGPTPAIPAPAPDGPIWTDAHQPARLGDVLVRIDSVRVGVVPLLVGHKGDAGESENQLLTVALTVENRGTTRKIDFRGFATNNFGLGPVAQLEDNFGNFYRRVGFGYTDHPKGQIDAAESIYPGKPLADLIVFEVPIDKATYLRLSLPGWAVGASDDAKLRFQIPASMFGGHAAADEQHEQGPAAEDPRGPRWRTWTTDGGKRTFDAKYLSAEGGTVKLEKADGTIIKIQIDELSNDDHKWITRDGWKRP